MGENGGGEMEVDREEGVRQIELQLGILNSLGLAWPETRRHKSSSFQPWLTILVHWQTTRPEETNWQLPSALELSSRRGVCHSTWPSLLRLATRFSQRLPRLLAPCFSYPSMHS